MSSKLPGVAGDIEQELPDVWSAYAALGEAVSKGGDLSARELRLVKLAYAIGAGSEGAVHSHVRRAVEEGIATRDLAQIAMLAISPLGFPRAAAAKTWIQDIVK
ncbi:carboxymuconolactone decarboxylase family protein [Aliiruegeria sabulilitoris]|uniref:carboxymuconolactone decarboxylase family protein n=1 Tax=Aliiruegeria sabulilitoris TaxID=1510458 RepID=UPI0008328274|nr:carboxymuconolactone decarboxylase family protein [Aliiruegeria sabulilitoris]NDR55705.1 carboxymuconolactone decarboxylase family protein [Pseudoruegeria sp. M32A2M]